MACLRRRDYDAVEGYCFRSLLIGRSSTLDFYRATPTPPLHAARAEALRVFKDFLLTAQQEHEVRTRASASLPAYARALGHASGCSCAGMIPR